MTIINHMPELITDQSLRRYTALANTLGISRPTATALLTDRHYLPERGVQLKVCAFLRAQLSDVFELVHDGADDDG